MAELNEKIPGDNAIFLYNSINRDINIKAGHKIHGKKLKNKNEMTSELQDELSKFKEYLKKQSYIFSDLEEYRDIPFIGIPTRRVKLNTPILKEKEWLSIKSMDDFIQAFENVLKTGSNGRFEIPDSLVNSTLGIKILEDLKKTSFSQKVFCHNYLNWKSIVLKNDSLYGVINWQYAGYYPPEFEDILEKYMEFI
jgi:thiamine kinase-like enzyme